MSPQTGGDGVALIATMAEWILLPYLALYAVVVRWRTGSWPTARAGGGGRRF